MHSEPRLPKITPFTYGTMSLGRAGADMTKDVAVARQAMEKDVWFHSSRAYGHGDGGTFKVLKQAFAEAPGQIPKMMFKVACESAELIRGDVDFTLKTLGLPKMEIAQLAGTSHDKRDIVDDFLREGPMFQTCRQLKEQGLVDKFVFEIFYSYSADGLKAVTHDLFDGYIFYYSLLERQVSNEIWAQLEARNLPILSLRPLAGAFLSNGPKVQERKLKDPAHPAFRRLEELAPLLEKSGCDTLIELSLRFLASQPLVKTTIAGTANATHLDELANAVGSAHPLDKQLTQELCELQSKWCREAESYKFAQQLW